MNFIQLQDRRINLNLVIQYVPTERSVDILNEPQTWYGITFYGPDKNVFSLNYETDVAARDLDLMTLDFVCVQNKRGNVKELQKVQQA